jgi:hypothetical protein
MATRGSTPNALAVAAEEIAVSASCAAVGFGLTAQSPNTNTLSARAMRNTEETMCTTGAV